MGSVATINQGTLDLKQPIDGLKSRHIKISDRFQKLEAEYLCTLKDCFTLKQFRKQMQSLNQLHYNTTLHVENLVSDGGLPDLKIKIIFSYIFQIRPSKINDPLNPIVKQIQQNFHQECRSISKKLNQYLKDQTVIPINIPVQQQQQARAQKNKNRQKTIQSMPTNFKPSNKSEQSKTWRF